MMMVSEGFLLKFMAPTERLEDLEKWRPFSSPGIYTKC